MCESSRNLSPVAKKKLKELKEDRANTYEWYQRMLNEQREAHRHELIAAREEVVSVRQGYEQRMIAMQTDLNTTRHELIAARDELRRLTSYVEAMRNALIHEIAATGPRTEG